MQAVSLKQLLAVLCKRRITRVLEPKTRLQPAYAASILNLTSK